MFATPLTVCQLYPLASVTPVLAVPVITTIQHICDIERRCTYQWRRFLLPHPTTLGKFPHRACSKARRYASCFERRSWQPLHFVLVSQLPWNTRRPPSSQGWLIFCHLRRPLCSQSSLTDSWTGLRIINPCSYLPTEPTPSQIHLPLLPSNHNPFPFR